jgi:uncharacterized protein YdhG (YjbR/CyaY superfamily)
MARTVDDYIAAQPPDVAHILERLRETIHKAAPGATEAIKYSMPVFRHGDGYIFYVGAWKRHIGLYPIHAQPPALEAALAPLRGSKDTVKLVHARPIPYELVRRLVHARIKELQAKTG